MVVKGSVSMAESVRKSKTHHLHLHNKKKSKKDLTDSDMVAAAAQQLMQLSDEENNNNNSNSGRNYKVSNGYGDEEVDQRVVKENGIKSGENNNNNNVMEEIFGKEEVLDFPAAKKRRYRSLAHIYMDTKPIALSSMSDCQEAQILDTHKKKITIN